MLFTEDSLAQVAQPAQLNLRTALDLIAIHSEKPVRGQQPRASLNAFTALAAVGSWERFIADLSPPRCSGRRPVPGCAGRRRRGAGRRGPGHLHPTMSAGTPVSTRTAVPRCRWFASLRGHTSRGQSKGVGGLRTPPTPTDVARGRTRHGRVSRRGGLRCGRKPNSLDAPRWPNCSPPSRPSSSSTPLCRRSTARSRQRGHLLEHLPRSSSATNLRGCVRDSALDHRPRALPLTRLRPVKAFSALITMAILTRIGLCPPLPGRS